MGPAVPAMHLQRSCRFASFMSHQLQPLPLLCGATWMRASRPGDRPHHRHRPLQELAAIQPPGIRAQVRQHQRGSSCKPFHDSRKAQEL